MKRKLFLFLTILICGGGLFSVVKIKTAQATPTAYWFNNAVNTSPATLGNYWLDAGLTTPATELPDLEEDEVTIVAGATYNGDAIIRGSATNEGTVTGNANFFDSAANNGTVDATATFWGDVSENFGIANEFIRRYNEEITTERNFQDNPWTIIADNAVVDVNGIRYDYDETFTTIGSGYFLSELIFTLSNVTASNNKVFIQLNRFISTSPIPDLEDFEFTQNSDEIQITNIELSNLEINGLVTLTLADSLENGEAMELTYTLGDHLILEDQGLNLNSFSISNVSYGILTGDAPVYSTQVGNKLYVSNNHSASITVIDTTTEAILSVIPVQNYPEFSVLVGKKLYVGNLQSASVSVIDTEIDEVVTTIPVVAGPYFLTVVGNKIYVSGTATNAMSVINTNTDTVVATVTVGNNPWKSGLAGRKLYVPNRTSNTVSVINTVTDTVTATISVPSINIHGTNAVTMGTKVYVGTQDSLAVIDSTTDTVVDNITVGTRPYFSCSYGGKVYAPNRQSGTLSVIDANTDSVIHTITLTGSPWPTTCVVVGSQIYVTNENQNNVDIIDGTTDTLLQSYYVGAKPFYATAVGSKVYVSNNTSNTLTIIDSTSISSLRPNLISFSTTANDGIYTAGQSILITAHFGQTLQAGSTMTVALNSGSSVVLSNVNGTTLSGTYTIGNNDRALDLAVTSITAASVTNTQSQTRTSYSLPRSQGDLVAENSFITRNLGDSHNITIGSYLQIPAGTNPYQMTSPITVNNTQYLYIANQGSDDVSVIRKLDRELVATIPVGSEPYGLTTASYLGVTYIYVINTGSDSVSVINTATNAVVATIAVGVKPYYATTVGSKVYVTNSLSNSVSVINVASNTVSSTIPVGSYPRGIKAYGTNVYVANYGDENYTGGNSIWVIDSTSDTVTTTINTPYNTDGPRGLNVIGSEVYVANFRSNNVSVINTATNTISYVIPVGAGPRGVLGVGTKVYVENFEDGTVSVIDTNTHSVIDTIQVGHSPSGIATDNTDIYISRFQDNKVSVLNPLTNSLRGAPAEISGTSVNNISPYNATILISTNKNTSAYIEYGLSSSYTETSTTSIGMTTSHSIYIQGLLPLTTYHYRAIVYDDDNNYSYGADRTFRTTAGGGGIIDIGSIKLPSADPLDPKSSRSDGKNHNENTIDESLSSKDQQERLNRYCIEWPRLAPVPIQNVALFSSVVGRFLLATEDRGRLWYVDPISHYRYEVTQSTALCLFESVSLGINQDNLNNISEVDTTRQPTSLGKRLQGRFLLNTENKGQTWYIDQTGLRHKVGISNLVSLAAHFALGITNVNLSLLPIGGER